MEQKQPLPNSTAVLVLGICSIVFSCLYVGLILGILGIVMGNKGRDMYKRNPEIFFGYGNLNAGWIMSIIGTILTAIYIVWVVIFVAILGLASGGMMNM